LGCIEARGNDFPTEKLCLLRGLIHKVVMVAWARPYSSNVKRAFGATRWWHPSRESSFGISAAGAA